jgi:hypothetical protein
MSKLMSAIEKLFRNLRGGASKSRETKEKSPKKSKTASLETTVDEEGDSAASDAGVETGEQKEQKELKPTPRGRPMGGALL